MWRDNMAPLSSSGALAHIGQCSQSQSTGHASITHNGPRLVLFTSFRVLRVSGGAVGCARTLLNVSAHFNESHITPLDGSKQVCCNRYRIESRSTVEPSIFVPVYLDDPTLKRNGKRQATYANISCLNAFFSFPAAMQEKP